MEESPWGLNIGRKDLSPVGSIIVDDALLWKG